MSSIYSLKEGNYPSCFLKNADHSLHNHFAFALISQAWTLHDIAHQFLGISLSCIDRIFHFINTFFCQMYINLNSYDAKLYQSIDEVET